MDYLRPLAKTLNADLDGTQIMSMLSDYGKRMFVPKGIIVQSTEAKSKAKRFNATIGVALEEGSVMYLPSVRENFSQSLQPSEIFSYAPMGGVLRLREVWKEEMIRKNPLLEGKTISLPVVCAGLTNALSIVASLFLDEGDTLVMPNLYWENYDLIFQQQRKAVYSLFDTFDGDGFNLKGLDEALSKVRDKAVVLLNCPNNPTGYTPTEDEAQKIADILIRHAQDKKLVVISDDAYFGLFFTSDVSRQSLFARICDASENLLAVKCDAATKEEMVWGFRVAFITYGFKGCDEKSLNVLVQKTMGCIRGSLSNCNTSAQNILLHAMESESYHCDKQRGISVIQGRYDRMKSALEKHVNDSCLKALPFNSGYFMSFETKCDAEQLRNLLLDKYQTGTICLGEHILRIAFSSVDEKDIESLVDTVYEAAGELA